MAESERDYYEILGVPRDASPAGIKKAYRALAVRFHPDRNPDDPSAGEAFKQASEAYSVLKDPEQRARYDRFGRAGVGGSGPRVNSDVARDIEDLFGGSVFDIFGDLFGQRGSRRRPERGRDVQYELAVEFDEPRHPTEKRVLGAREEPCDPCSGSGARQGTRPIVCGRCRGSGQETIARGMMVMSRTCSACRGQGEMIRTPCPECSGRGRVAVEREIPVRIPAGIDDGVQLRIPGQGHLGRNGGPPGDMYVRIHVRPAPGMERDGNDVLTRASLSIPEAALGTRIEVGTIWGPETVRVPAGTQPEATLSLSGKGFPALRGRGRGDHLVTIGVEIPKRMNRETRRAMESLAAALKPGENAAKRGPRGAADEGSSMNGARERRPGRSKAAPGADQDEPEGAFSTKGSLFGRLFSSGSPKGD